MLDLIIIGGEQSPTDFCFFDLLVIRAVTVVLVI